MIKLVPCASALTHLGMIILLFITVSEVTLSAPIPSLFISLILQRLARVTVVPSKDTGSNTATGDMAKAAQLHSI